MKDINAIILTGRLTGDPEARYINNSNTPTASFNLAVNRGYTKKDDPNAQTADFIRCQAYGKLAEVVNQYYKKGMKAFVRGRIKTGSYKNKDNITVYTTDVIVEDIGFGESKNAANNSEEITASVNNYGNNTSNGFSGGYQNGNGYSMGNQGNTQSVMNIPEGIDEVLPFS